jgi:hypothetical protein
MDPGPGPKPTPRSVALHYQGTPAFLAYRDGEGDWETLTGDATLQVTGPYEIVSACVLPSQDVFAEIRHLTPDDGATVEFSCISLPALTGKVTGAMAQPGTVTCGDVSATDPGLNGPWTFELANLPEGDNEVVAINDTSVLVEHGIYVSGDVTLPTIDLNAGSPLSTLPLTIQGVQPGEVVDASVSLDTAHAHASISSGTSTAVKLVPASQLQSGDVQSLFVDVQGAVVERSAYVRDFTGSQTTFVLPPPFAADLTPSGSSPSVTWQQLPTNDSVQWELSGYGHVYVDTLVSASERWLATTGGNALTLDLPPGYDPRLAMNAAGGYDSLLTAQNVTADGITYSVALSHHVGPGSAR